LVAINHCPNGIYNGYRIHTGGKKTSGRSLTKPFKNKIMTNGFSKINCVQALLIPALFACNTSAGLNHGAIVVGDQSGIPMEIFTRDPGLQFYGGNFMKRKNTFKNGSKDDLRTAFCLETQHFPDSPNQPSFPSKVLDPGKKYQTKSVDKFSVK
jgi:galactose mutarotase-like enzyme